MTLHTEFFDIHPTKHFWVEIYHLMNSIVQPRPIAWISSVSKTGEFNLAPFSYFNICSMNPPIISNSIFFNRDGSEKDTLKNIKATGKYVVGTVSFEAANKANKIASEMDDQLATQALLELFNKSWSSDDVPASWKLSDIRPIPKPNKNLGSAENY